MVMFNIVVFIRRNVLVETRLHTDLETLVNNIQLKCLLSIHIVM